MGPSRKEREGGAEVPEDPQREEFRGQEEEELGLVWNQTGEPST